MEDKKSYYECKRCFFKCYQKNTMKKHLDKLKTCDRILDSYKYNDDELYDLSMIRIYTINKDAFCKICEKEFKNIFSLKRHQNTFHKNNNFEKGLDNTTNNDNNIENSLDNKDINNNYNILNGSIINSNINATTNINSTTNIVNNNNNISINIINFDDNWNTSHIDCQQKILLFLKNYKFTTTLENILENAENLNVLIDNTSNNGIVCNNNKFEKMEINEIVKKTMKKLLDSLITFKNEIYEKNIHDLDLDIIDTEMKKANLKYDEFKKNKFTQNDVNNIIKNIYTKKKDNTYNICKSTGY
jgi:hypothetical protein